ncbi:hypothetical protein BDV30DRAFT_245480 [Aspergillus minisclerotigenes]|uniref:Uncharacterized protein n=1 Tax=Aspergillus minisclerotigenes TaxID=656917 RepID=A0A5N6JGQ1_9EURO|nr:hypothetical protein BDV30DRAFT_245480 [Aspergillus minisclerotigenes]
MADFIFNPVSNGNTLQYPVGKARIENIGNIYFLIMMASALNSVQWWIDPMGVLWLCTSIEECKLLIGVTADIVRAYHAGPRLIVEVDVDLQNKLQNLMNVDRAFVHIGYETTHRPEHAKMIDNNLAAERTNS